MRQVPTYHCLFLLLCVLQALGCTANLAADGKYCIKRRLCRQHLKVRQWSHWG
jgi:hypothetical protein